MIAYTIKANDKAAMLAMLLGLPSGVSCDCVCGVMAI